MIQPVTNDEVLRVFENNIDKVKELLYELIKKIDLERL